MRETQTAFGLINRYWAQRGWTMNWQRVFLALGAGLMAALLAGMIGWEIGTPDTPKAAALAGAGAIVAICVTRRKR